MAVLNHHSDLFSGSSGALSGNSTLTAGTLYKVSTCQLEVDVAFGDILNRHLIQGEYWCCGFWQLHGIDPNPSLL